MSKPCHRRLLSMLGLAPSVVRALQDANLLHDEDVRDLTLTDLQEVSGLQVSECCEVLRLASGATGAAATANTFTVLDMIESSPEVGHIVTLSSTLDSLLGGGLPLRAVTEVAGTPGAGKTQLCLQAAVSVQLPAAVGGVGGEAVILDAEGSVAATRIQEMAEYAIAHYKRVSKEGGGGDPTPADEEGRTYFTTEGILRRIHYYRCLSQLSVVACIKLLPALLRDHPNIKLVVIDSIAFHLRHDVPDNRVRTGLLCSMTQDLVQLATRHHLAVLVTNQMTTRITPNTINSTSIGGSTSAADGGGGFSNAGNGIGGSSSCLIPALGESWGHCPTVRLVLRWQQGIRTASLLKAPHAPHGTASFQVTAAGIRDVAAAQHPQLGPFALPRSAQERGSSSTDAGGGGRKRRLSHVE